MLILHVARTPKSGVWSLMTNLATWQAQGPDIAAMRIITDRTWPESQDRELSGLDLDTGTRRLPWMYSGTANFLSHLALSPLPQWIAELERRHRPRAVVVHFHDAWRAGAFLPIRSNVSLPVRTLATFHGVGAGPTLRKQHWRRRIHAWMASRLLAYGCRLVSVDADGVDTAHELFGLPRSSFTIVPNGVARCTASPQPRPPGFIVGFVSLFYRDKGWHIVAQAAAMLARRCRDVQLWMAGTGPDVDEARAWCERNKSFAKFLGFVQDAGRTIIPQLDALVLPSTHEGLPMAVLEAMAAGVPVLATPVGGIPTVIDDGVNGFFIRRDERDVSDRLWDLAGDPERHRRMKAKALEKYEREFSIGSCGRRYREIYEALLRDAAKAAGSADAARG